MDGREVRDEDIRQDVLDLAVKAERTLRTLLPSRGLAPEAIVAELRRTELISISVAANLHDLFGCERRLLAGESARAEDRRLAMRAVRGLEEEIATPPSARALREAGGDDQTLVHPVPVSDTEGRGGRGRLIAAALVLILVIAGAVYLVSRGDDDARMQQGIALFRTGAYADAASHFYRYAQDHPDEVTPHLYLARIHRRLDRPDLAGPELTEALRLAPEDPAVHRELGFYFLDSRRYESAIERFREALRLEPSSETAWVGMVQALRMSGQLEASNRILEQAPAEVQALLGGR